MIQQITAAAASLNDQAGRLKEEMAVFQLLDGAVAAASTPDASRLTITRHATTTSARDVAAGPDASNAPPRGHHA